MKPMETPKQTEGYIEWCQSSPWCCFPAMEGFDIPTHPKGSRAGDQSINI